MNQSYTIRTMTRSDLDVAVNWAAEEGWNPGLGDADCFFACDPSGFFMGERDGAPVACISAVAYGAVFGFIGFYIVRPGDRGKGFGLQIWNTALAYLGDRTIGLDGVVAQQDNYRKSGFVLAHRNERYQGTGGGVAPEGVSALAEVPFERLAAYDARIFSCPRPAFLSAWISRPGGHAAALWRQGRLEGYGVIRPCRNGFKIGPLFADTPDGAEALFLALASHVPGQAVFLDVPQPNAAAVALARRHGMSPVFETARMYTKSAPDLPLDRVFGITSFELG